MGWMCRGSIEGDVAVILVRRMETTQLIENAHSSAVTVLEFSKHGRYSRRHRETL